MIIDRNNAHSLIQFVFITLFLVSEASGSTELCQKKSVDRNTVSQTESKIQVDHTPDILAISVPDFCGEYALEEIAAELYINQTLFGYAYLKLKNDKGFKKTWIEGYHPGFKVDFVVSYGEGPCGCFFTTGPYGFR